MACGAIKHGASYCRAEEEFGVPRSTLYDHISGHVAPSAHSGPHRYLSDQKEKELVNFLIGCSRFGYARTRKQVIALVEASLGCSRIGYARTRKQVIALVEAAIMEKKGHTSNSQQWLVAWVFKTASRAHSLMCRETSLL